jgi:Amidohydrolase family
MRRVGSLVVLLGVLGVLSMCPTAKADDTSHLIIHDVAIVDTRTGKLFEDKDVAITGDRIVSIEPAKAALPKDEILVDGHDKFLIPGLWDMEVHLSWTTESALPLLVANGVTDVRDMGSKLDQIDDWRTRISEGSLVGPHILRVGPMLNGKSFNEYQMVVGPPEQTRGVVRTLKFLGMDGLSLERRVPRDSYFALLDEAKREQIPVGGHIPIGIKPEEASDAGQATIENIDTLFEFMLTEGIPEEKIPAAIGHFLASGDADKLFTLFKRNHTAYTPALSQFQWSLQAADASAPKDPRMEYVAKSQRNFFAQHPIAASDLRAMEAMAPEMTKVVGRMSRDGVLLLAGTDIAGPRIPGFSLQDELSMLVKAGLTPLQALQTATLNPAVVLHSTNDFGTAEPGKSADVVLLDANPLEDIGNTGRISAVVVRGRLFRRSDLDGLLRKAQQLANQN